MSKIIITFIKFLEKQLAIQKIKFNLLLKKYNEVTSQIKIALVNYPEDVYLLKIAQIHYRNVGYEEGLFEIYEQVIKSSVVNQLQAQRNFGFALMGVSRYGEAVAHLNYCVENWNLGVDYEGALANIHARLGICYLYLGQWERAHSELQQADRIAPWDSDVLYGRLLLYIDTQNVDKVDAFLDEQIKRYPKHYFLFYWKALYTQYCLGDIVKSLHWYDIALRKIDYLVLRKKYYPYFVTPIRFASPNMILDKTVKSYVKAGKAPLEIIWLILSTKIKTLDKSIDIKASITKFYLEKGELLTAEKLARSLLNQRPDGNLSNYQVLLSVIQLQQGNLADSLSNVIQAIKSEEHNSEAYAVLGKIFMLQQDWVLAIDAYEKALKINRFDFKSWKDLGLCYLSFKNFVLAKTSFEKAIQINPFDGDSWANLGFTYNEIKEDALARASLEKALNCSHINKNNVYKVKQILTDLQKAE